MKEEKEQEQELAFIEVGAESNDYERGNKRVLYIVFFYSLAKFWFNLFFAIFPSHCGTGRRLPSFLHWPIGSIAFYPPWIIFLFLSEAMEVVLALRSDRSWISTIYLLLRLNLPPKVELVLFTSYIVGESTPCLVRSPKSFLVRPVFKRLKIVLLARARKEIGYSNGVTNIPLTLPVCIYLDAWNRLLSSSSFEMLFDTRNGTERASPDSIFIVRVAGQRTKEGDQSHQWGKGLLSSQKVIKEHSRSKEVYDRLP